MLRAPTAAGKDGLTRLPAGAVMVTASNNPLFGNRPGSSNAFTALEHVAFRPLSGTLSAPFDCGAVPAKSKSSRPSATRTVTVSAPSRCRRRHHRDRFVKV